MRPALLLVSFAFPTLYMLACLLVLCCAVLMRVKVGSRAAGDDFDTVTTSGS
jgi:hypothetical protein